jgi:hypothetical protein
MEGMSRMSSRWSNCKDGKDNQQKTIISSVILPVFSNTVTKNS